MLGVSGGGWCPVLRGHLSPQFALATDKFQLGYTEGGHCRGEPNTSLAPPQRLQWDLPEEVGPTPTLALWEGARGLPSVPHGIRVGSVHPGHPLCPLAPGPPMASHVLVPPVVPRAGAEQPASPSQVVEGEGG